MKFDFNLDNVELELSTAKNVLWIPAIPAKELKAYKGRRISITEKYLKAAASETKRFYEDLKKVGSSYKRPILCAHDDNGRRSGSLLDFAVRTYKGIATLFVKGEFFDEAYNAILNGTLSHGSISILPEYTDAESGTTYTPFIKEWSETHSPVVKGFTVSELYETSSQLATLNLTLSEDNMNEEEFKVFADELLSKIGVVIDEKLAPVIERLDTLEGGEEEPVEEDDAKPGDAEGAGNGDAADTKVSASESNVIDFASIAKRLEGIEKKLDRTERVRAKGRQASTTGTPIVASETKKKKKLTAAQQLEKIKTRDGGLYGIAAVTARIEESKNV